MDKIISRADVLSLKKAIELRENTIEQLQDSCKKACIEIFKQFNVECIALKEPVQETFLGEVLTLCSHVEYDKETDTLIGKSEEGNAEWNEPDSIYQKLIDTVNFNISVGLPTRFWHNPEESDGSKEEFAIDQIEPKCNFEPLLNSVCLMEEYRIKPDDAITAIMLKNEVTALKIPAKNMPEIPNASEGSCKFYDCYATIDNTSWSDHHWAVYFSFDKYNSSVSSYDSWDMLLAVVDTIEEYQNSNLPKSDWGGGTQYTRALEAKWDEDCDHLETVIISDSKGKYMSTDAIVNTSIEILLNDDWGIKGIVLSDFLYLPKLNGWESTSSLSVNSLTVTAPIKNHYRQHMKIGTFGLAKLMEHYKLETGTPMEMMEALATKMAEEARVHDYKSMFDFAMLCEELGIWVDYNYNPDNY